MWILHQYRMAYELWNHPLVAELIHFPRGKQVRALIQAADRDLIPRAKAVFANSLRVAARLQRDCAVAATPLYHPPPHAEQFSSTRTPTVASPKRCGTPPICSNPRRSVGVPRNSG